MSLAGNRTQAVEYLLGNHFIAESMFRHDPHALLCAPLRVLSTGTLDRQSPGRLNHPTN